MGKLQPIWSAKATGPTEIIMGLTMLSYGIGSVFFVSSRVIQSGMTAIFIIIAIWRILTVIHGHIGWRQGLTIVSAITWAYLWILSAFYLRPINARVITFLTWAAIELWICYRLGLGKGKVP